MMAAPMSSVRALRLPTGLGGPCTNFYAPEKMKLPGPGSRMCLHDEATQKIDCPVIAPRFSPGDRKSTRLNSSHQIISYAVFCLKKKKTNKHYNIDVQSGHNSERTH